MSPQSSNIIFNRNIIKEAIEKIAQTVSTDIPPGSDNMATLLMWVIYLGNAIIMLIKWEREAKLNKEV
ncbi:UNVERIFIED_CONTAM: hypothetical protein MUK63_06295 [Blautia caecimuris]